MTLPCRHERPVTEQVQPTVELLTHLDTMHPEVLCQHAIQPEDYQGGLVFRSAIESIRGTFIASSTTGREGLVRDVLENLLVRKLIAGYQQNSSKERYDFTVEIDHDLGYFVALEVKGGEGNSINISERPIWAKEFGIWSHLDGAIVNQPAHGAHAILNRLTNELVRRHKPVDILFFKDCLCGTRTRPCPKYPGCEEKIGLSAAPDIFLFPQRIPTVDDPEPPVYTLEMLKLPTLVLDLFNVSPADRPAHVWEVGVRVHSLADRRFCWSVQVRHQGVVVDRNTSRPWQV